MIELALAIVLAVAAALIAVLGLTLITAPEAEAGKLGKAKKEINKKLRAEGKQPIKVSCRMKGKPHKPPGRYARCKWAAAEADATATILTCRGEAELRGKRKRQRLRFKQTGCKADKGATQNSNEFMPAQLAKQGFESTDVFCFTNLVNGYKCKWEALNFRLNVIEDCTGRAKNIKKKVSIRVKRCGTNEVATQAQSAVKKRLSAQGLSPGQIKCRPGGTISCEYRATTAAAGWTYSCEGGATLQSSSSPPRLDRCNLHAPDLAPLKTAGPRPDFGVNEGWPLLLGQLDELRDIGANTARMSVPWNAVQPSPGGFNFSSTDPVYNAMLSKGLKPVIILTGAPCWATAGSGCGFAYPPSSAHFGSWGAFAAAVAARYPQALAIEVWNEANQAKFFHGAPRPGVYAGLLKSAYQAIKAVRPQMTVLTTGTAAHANNEPGQQRYDEFLRDVYEHGTKNFSDAIAHHGYPGGGPEGDHKAAIRAQLADVKDVMLDFGDHRKDIWITETGVSTTAGNKSYSPSQQAKVYADLYKIYRRVPGIPTVIYHRWRDLPSGNGPESGFGLQRSNGDRKPAYCALANAAGSPC